MLYHDPLIKMCSRTLAKIRRETRKPSTEHALLNYRQNGRK